MKELKEPTIKLKKGWYPQTSNKNAVFFVQTSILTRRKLLVSGSILIQNFLSSFGDPFIVTLFDQCGVRQVLARETSPGCLIKGCPFYGAICQIILGELWYCWWKKIPNNHLRCMETLYFFHIWDTANSPLKFLRYPETSTKTTLESKSILAAHLPAVGGQPWGSWVFSEEIRMTGWVLEKAKRIKTPRLWLFVFFLSLAVVQGPDLR